MGTLLLQSNNNATVADAAAGRMQVGVDMQVSEDRRLRRVVKCYGMQCRSHVACAWGGECSLHTEEVQVCACLGKQPYLGSFRGRPDV